MEGSALRAALAAREQRRTALAARLTAPRPPTPAPAPSRHDPRAEAPATGGGSAPPGIALPPGVEIPALRQVAAAMGPAWSLGQLPPDPPTDLRPASRAPGPAPSLAAREQLREQLARILREDALRHGLDLKGG
ncbi:MAG: hypothetical protein ACOY93_13810 [Bacillota bacterium]